MHHGVLLGAENTRAGRDLRPKGEAVGVKRVVTHLAQTTTAPGLESITKGIEATRTLVKKTTKMRIEVKAINLRNKLVKGRKQEINTSLTRVKSAVKGNGDTIQRNTLMKQGKEKRVAVRTPHGLFQRLNYKRERTLGLVMAGSTAVRTGYHDSS